VSDFKSIQGFRIKARDSDPSNPLLGEVWYNTTTDLYKVRSVTEGSNVFASGGNLPAGFVGGSGSPAGTQNAAIYAAGVIYPTGSPTGPSALNRVCHEYDGNAYTTGGTMNRTTGTNGSFPAGTQTATLVSGGTNPYTTAVEEYDGSSWSNQNGFGVDISYGGGCGTQNAALACGGYNAPELNDVHPFCQEYDGTNWASGGSLNLPRMQHECLGLQTNAVAVGGYRASIPPTASPTGTVSNVEEYNGSSWTNVTSIPILVQVGGAMGVETDGLYAGGARVDSPTGPGTGPSSSTNLSFTYDGTSWTAGGNLVTAADNVAVSGTGQLQGTVMGGSNPTDVLNSTQEYGVGSPFAATKIITVS